MIVTAAHKSLKMATAMHALVLASVVFSAEAASELARGWGDGINWITLDKALERSKEENKPVMLVIHKSWCGACKALKPKFAESSDIEKLSEEFLMVNVEDDEEPPGDMYKPDGGYIPRILFLNSEGKLLDDVYNKNGNSKYKYFYNGADGVVESMQTVLKYHNRANDEIKQEL